MKTGHDEECACCSGKMTLEGLKKWEDDCMKKYGFFMHYVPVQENYINAHTHGIEKTWSHPDLQIVLRVQTETINSLMHSVVDLIKAGEKIWPGRNYHKILQKYPVRFVEAEETGRKVLRMILPDKAGHFPGDDGVSEWFEGQLTLKTD